MARMALVALFGCLIGGGALADEGEARLWLRMGYEEASQAMSDREHALDHWRASLAITEQAYELSEHAYSQLQALALLAERAFYAEEHTKAKIYATRALALAADLENPRVFSFGNAIHHANLVLGKLALLDDNLESAGEHLLAAGRTPGSPQLDTFGPNMALAKLLLERGQRAVVLEYFALCRRFWRLGVERGTLDGWSRIMEIGGIPDFGANLIYGL